MKSLQGFCLAAGLGTRMGPLSSVLPKPLWTIQGLSLLDWGLEVMRKEGMNEVAANTSMHAALMKIRHPKINFFTEDAPLGSAGWFAHVASFTHEPLTVWNADVIARDVPFRHLAEAHRWNPCDLTWMLVPHPGGPWTKVYLADQDRISFSHTDRGPYHFVGASVWEQSIQKWLPEGFVNISDVLEHLDHRGVVVPPFPWQEIGTPQALIRAAAEWAPDQEGRLTSNYIHPSAYAEGKFTGCIFGPDVVVIDEENTNTFYFMADEGLQRLRL